MRIQKWISQLGRHSRRQTEKLIRDGLVQVNGQPAQLGQIIDPQNDHIKIAGQLVTPHLPPRVYWLFHKPDQTLVSHKPDNSKPTIFQLPTLKKINFLLYTVGRLDFRTEGLLLLSNDGQWVEQLSHPRFEHPRRYQALVNGRLTQEQVNQINQHGIELSDGWVKKIRLRRIQGMKLGQTQGSWYFITVFEGRNRLVRRIFEHFDLHVIKLIRTGYAHLELPNDLKPGHYRPLTKAELKEFRKLTKKKDENHEVCH